jgi:hypothetical protein
MTYSPMGTAGGRKKQTEAAQSEAAFQAAAQGPLSPSGGSYTTTAKTYSSPDVGPTGVVPAPQFF